MPIYDDNGTTKYLIGKLYDDNDTTKYQTKYVYDNDGTTNRLIYAAEETFTKSITNTYKNNGGHFTFDANGNPTGWVPDSDDYSAITKGTINIPVGETFRINSLRLDTSTPGSSTSTEITLSVNGTKIVNKVYGGGQTVSLGPYPSTTNYYTSSKASNTIEFTLRGKVSASQYGDSPIRTLTIQYTTGV